MDIESADELRRALDDGTPLSGLRLQGLDLRACADAFSGQDVRGLVVLGGDLPGGLARDLTDRGAIVFPGTTGVPVDVYRASLYSADELYAGLDGHGYPATPDARAYAWSREPALVHDAYAAVLRAMHDAAIGDALGELVDGRDVVGVMGGHALARGSDEYAAAARLGNDLAHEGLVVATGGGPGAMEAANLGALAPGAGELGAALTDLAACPSFRPDIGRWAQVALDVRARLRGAGSRAVTSVGIPTWFYGHEPPNVFCDGIAKYFSNAEREDGLLARSTAGIIVLAGAAGTAQEIFQALTPRYYAADGARVPPLVLVGVRQWTVDVPVWPAVQALAAGRPMEHAVHLVDDLDSARRLVVEARSAD